MARIREDEISLPGIKAKPTGAERAAATIGARKTRFAEEVAAREASKPTEDPGPGNIWSYSVSEGRWKKVFTGAGLGGGAIGGSTVGGGTTDSGTTGGGVIGGGTTGGGTTTTYTAPDGKIFTDLNAYNAYIAQLGQEAKTKDRQSAYDFLFEQFNQYGLGSLVENIKDLITSNVPPGEFAIRLRDTDAYKKRFAANAQRVAKGLRALDEATYIGLEDQYQEIMRNYGLPESYYARGELGRQEGFEKLIANDVSNVELEDRISTAYNRVTNANPEIAAALRDFYPDITNGDILAYVLNPDKGLAEIKRKVTAAEIGGAARQFGLGTSATRAEELAKYGVTKQLAQEQYQAIGGGLERGRQLSQIYQQPEYTQTTAETELFGLAGAPEAGRQRRRIASMERATFGGTAGATGGALARDRAGAI